MPTSLGNPETPIARKEHTCNFCNQKIQKGEKYNRHGLVYDGAAYSWKSHIHCDELASHFKMYDDCWDEGLTGDDFREQVWEIYKDSHPEAKWDRGNEIPISVNFCVELMNKQKAEKNEKAHQNR